MAIKKDITVTVENKKSIMSDSVWIYQGDKNIDVYFTIVDNRFEFSTVTPQRYSFTIRKPDGNLLPPTEITALVEGKVKFTITQAMADELNEVGIYDILIHLYDDLDSRISIPEISFEVKQPLVTTNALTSSGFVESAVLDSINDTLERLDSNGNYVKTVWSKGDVITKENLNKIENQLSETSSQLVGIVNDKTTIIETLNAPPINPEIGRMWIELTENRPPIINSIYVHSTTTTSYVVSANIIDYENDDITEIKIQHQPCGGNWSAPIETILTSQEDINDFTMFGYKVSGLSMPQGDYDIRVKAKDTNSYCDYYYSSFKNTCLFFNDFNNWIKSVTLPSTITATFDNAVIVADTSGASLKRANSFASGDITIDMVVKVDTTLNTGSVYKLKVLNSVDNSQEVSSLVFTATSNGIILSCVYTKSDGTYGGTDWGTVSINKGDTLNIKFEIIDGSCRWFILKNNVFVFKTSWLKLTDTINSTSPYVITNVVFSGSTVELTYYKESVS